MKDYIKNFKRFLNEDAITGGKSDNLTLKDIALIHDPKGYYDINQYTDSLNKKLQKGIEVEMEHTANVEIAKEIAMDHMAEDPNYYEKLKTVHEQIKHEGDMWNLYSNDGKKLLGSYDSRKEARRQQQAVNKKKLG